VCDPTGPGVDAIPVGFAFGGRKPPAGYQSYDLHIRNPSPGKVWLLIQGDGAFPAATSSVTVERNRTEPAIFRWSFDGYSPPIREAGLAMADMTAGEFRAFYVAPNADVTLRGVVIDTVGPPATVRIRFVDTMYIAGRWAQEWLGHDATIPLRGDVTLNREWERVIRREDEHPECAVAEVHVLCVEDIGTNRAAGH
jgi:hypothetical protein